MTPRKRALKTITTSDAKLGTLITNTGLSVEWAELILLRPKTIVNENVPPYLLLPEVRRLIERASTFEISVFFELLFVTGARISEAMLLTPSSFFLNGDDNLKQPHVLIPTLKRRRASKKLIKRPDRLINLEPEFVARFQQFLGSIRRSAHKRIFAQSRSTLSRWFERECKKHDFDIEVSAHTLRHSCAVHLILLGYDVKYVQQFMGHANTQSTECYTAVALPLLQRTRPPVRFR